MNVMIRTIAHGAQRYDTVGDWTWHGDDLEIRVSDMGDWKKEMSVAYHELFEALVCKARRIGEKEVDEFDMKWAKTFLYEEPGDSKNAPYHREHQLAMAPEHILVDALGLLWADYEEAVNSL